MKFFGTDGIRMKTEKFLEDNFSKRVAIALCSAFKVKKVILARDTRIGGDKIIAQLKEGFKEYGIDIVDLGIVPTPAVAYATVSQGADYGIMVSASHNPPEYNGIKIFSKFGYKISAEQEFTLEKTMEGEINKTISISNSLKQTDGNVEYINYILKKVNYSFKKHKILLDTAYGATCKSAPAVFEALGAKVDVVNGDFNGDKINVNCGSTHIEELDVDKKYFLALAFDGDGDRVLAKTPKGKILDGDAIMYILALYLKSRKELNNDTVVGTVLTNSALAVKLSEYGISLKRTSVGDKYIQKELVEKDLSLGGEQSGHLILDGLVKTGDGILSGAMLIRALMELKINPDKIDYIPYPQKSINIKCENLGNKICEDERLKEFISNSNKENLRVILRPSGTEPIVRVMAEGEYEEEIDSVLEKAAALVQEVYDNLKVSK